MTSSILLRCDVGARVGMGHYRRCRALAGAMRDEGLAVHSRIGLESGGMRPERLGETDWVEAGTEDWEEFSQVARGYGLVVIDHYELAVVADQRADFPWMRFDAGGRREATTAQLIHNALPGIQLEDYGDRLRNPKARVLAGPEFALLDGSFARERGRKEMLGIKRILLTFGGGDDRGATQVALAALEEVCPQARRVVVTTSANPSLQELQELATRFERIELRVNEADMARVMSEVDVAITAGGTTLNELACLGIPAWVVPIADNQVRPARLWAEAGVVRYGGRFSGDEAFVGLGDFLRNECELRAMSERGFSLVDGLGAQRTAQALRQLLSCAGEANFIISRND